MATTSYGYANFQSLSLTAGLTASDTTVSVNDASGLPNEGHLVIDPGTAQQEIIYYTSKSSNDLILPSVGAGRGQGGTSAAAHSNGVTVKMNTVAEMFEALQDGTALADGAIATAKIADDAVTAGKLDSNLVASSYVSTSESRGSTSYGALSTVDECTLTVPASGKVELFWGALTDSGGAALTAWMLITLTGANSASYATRCSVPASGSNVGSSMSHSIVLTGLTPGSTTFTATYKGSASTSTSYSTRSIIVKQVP